MIQWRWLGLVDITEALALQEKLLFQKQQGDPTNYILCAEHYPVFTYNRPANITLRVSQEEFNALNIPMLQVGRGGGITYHGPGQLVCYLILDVQRFKLSPKAIGQLIDGVISQYLNTMGITTMPGPPLKGAEGIWVGDHKIASRGVKFARGISTFGFALNITTDLAPYDYIFPCGLDIQLTSLEKELEPMMGITPSVTEVAEKLCRLFARELEEELAAAT